MYKITNKIVKEIPEMKLRSKSYIIAHDSGNARNTGNDSLENEVDYMSKNWKKAFTQFWVGADAIVQIAKDGFMAYGAGGYLNPHSPAQVELARVDTQKEFDESYKRYVWLLREMADKYGIPKSLDSNSRSGIKTHEWVTNNLGGTTHSDPYGYLAKWGISKAQFKKDVENGIAVPKPTSKSSKGYLVKSGDTMSEIAQKYKVSLKELMALNPSIQNANLIRVDQVINVPKVEVKQYTNYRVKYGDTFGEIAQKYKTTQKELKRLNPKVKDINKIYVNQVLIVPKV